MSGQNAHPLFTHPNGDQCIWLDGAGWFVPLDVGGEGYCCPLDHPTADEPTALAGYMVAPNAWGQPAIWRTNGDLFPMVAVHQADIDPALWDVLVAAVERGQA